MLLVIMVNPVVQILDCTNFHKNQENLFRERSGYDSGSFAPILEEERIMKVSYESAIFVRVKVLGVSGEFCDERVNKATVPRGKYLYEVADGNSDGVPARVQKHVAVDFYGTLITEDPLPLDENDTLFLKPTDFKVFGENQRSVQVLNDILDGRTSLSVEDKIQLRKMVRHFEEVEKERKLSENQATVLINLDVVITNEDIDDIMCIALEGGITYWCEKVEVVGGYLGEFASDQISRGGTLILFDSEEDKQYELTKEKLINGILMYLKQPVGDDFLEMVDHKLHLDTACVDAIVADAIVQYALFNEIVYG